MTAFLRLTAWFWVGLLAASSARALTFAGPPAQISLAVNDIEVTKGIAYLVTTGGLEILDASKPAAGYTTLGSFPGSFGSVEVRGAFAYLLGPSGLQIVDVSDPRLPVGLGALPIDSPSLALDVVGGFAYAVVSPLILQVVDVSNPAAPVALGSLDLGVSYPPGHAAIAIEEGVAYLNSAYGVASVDVSNPAAPALIAWFDLYGSNFFEVDVEVRNHILYASALSSFDGLPECRILDVTDAAAPVDLAHIQSACMQIDLVGDLLYSADLWEMQTVDVSDPKHPAPLGSLYALGPPTETASPFGITAMAVGGGFAHVATGYLFQSLGSLQAVDVRVPGRPQRTFSEGHPYWTVEVAGEQLYAAFGSILDVFHLDDALHPVYVSTVQVPGFVFDFEVAGPTAYVAGLGGLAVVDLADPAHPRQVTIIPGPAYSVERAGNRLYVGTGGLEVYDITAPTSPARLGSLTLSTEESAVVDLDLAGDVLYATGRRGVRAIDVEDPTSPHELGRFPAGFLFSAAISRDLLYVANLGGGLILDPSDPTTLRKVGTFGEGLSFTDLESVGDRIYAAAFDRVLVFDGSQPTAPQLLGGAVAGRGIALSGDVAYSAGYSLAGIFAVDFGPEYAPTLAAEIDVSPGDPGNGVVITRPGPLFVGLLGSRELDVRDVDRRSLALGPDGARARVSVPIPLNRDRRLDLLSMFRVADAGIAITDTQICLTGRIQSGRRLRGCDAIQPIAACGRGYGMALLVPLVLPLARAARRVRFSS